jgi:hypothetical protein
MRGRDRNSTREFSPEFGWRPWLSQMQPSQYSGRTEMAGYGFELRGCVTCAYWGGPRKATDTSAGMDVYQYATGRCNHVNRRGVLCNENAICEDWFAIHDARLPAC